MTLLKYRYTLTKRYQDSSNEWRINFQAVDKSVTLKNVMGTSYPVISGNQLWQNIVTNIEQTIMEDVNTSSATWKTVKTNAATISLKTTWQPTFEWKENILVLKGVAYEDVFARDSQFKVQPLSSVAILVSFAETFGLLVKDKAGKYLLGLN